MILRETLNQAIDDLKREVVEMADLALENIKNSIIAFQKNDIELARLVIEKDDEVDRLEERIAKNALRIIWKEQPLAKDLRLVTGILKLITDIERLGDHATDISEITLHISHVHNKRLLPITTKMFDLAQAMVLKAIESLIKVDDKLAREVIAEDDAIDTLFKEIISKMAVLLREDKSDPDYIIYVLMVGKYVERIGDHAVNIAEWIIYIASGVHKNTSLF